MAIEITYRCRCGETRKQTNHWFVAVAFHRNGGLYFYTWQEATEEGILQEDNTVHLCGQRCAQQLLDEWMSSQLGGNHAGT